MKLADGTVHTLPADLKEALSLQPVALRAWQSLTPLARNEWICWVISVKQEKTRENHVARTITELVGGVRRPCCWMGCIHRTDKELSPSVKGILEKRKRA